MGDVRNWKNEPEKELERVGEWGRLLRARGMGQSG